MKRTIQFTLLMGLGLSIFSFCAKSTPKDEIPKPPMPSDYYTDEEGRTEMTLKEAKFMGNFYDMASATPGNTVPFSYKDLKQWNSVVELITTYNGTNLNSDIGMYSLKTDNKDLSGGRIKAKFVVYTPDGMNLTYNYWRLLGPDEELKDLVIYLDSPKTRDNGFTYLQVFFSLKGKDYFVKLPTVKITNIS